MFDQLGTIAIVVRVANEGSPAFQLRKGEEGLSVFDPHAVEPPLTEAEILEPFREGSCIVVRQRSEVEALGLLVESTQGAATLPERLRTAHCEILPGLTMARAAFKNALKELE